MTKLRDLIDEMKASGVFEDRREYGLDDLQKMYKLDDQETEDLHYLIQREFRPDSGGSLDSVPEEVVKEYLQESIHSDWEGWDDEHDKIVLMQMIDDLIRYNNHR